MVLQSSGAISFSDVQTEFGGTNPISMSEYFSDGMNATAVSGIPASANAINMGTFRGKSKQLPITSSTTYYTDLTRVNGSAFNIIQGGTDPNVQLQMNSSSYTGQVTHVYGQERLQDFSRVVITFEIFISSTSVADALWFYMGQTTTPSSSTTEGNTGTGYQLIFEVFNGNVTIPQGISLYKNGSTSAVNYSTTSHIASQWLQVAITYNKSSTNTWYVSFNGSNIISYSDPSHSTWLSNTGRFWGFGSRVGGSTGDFWLRRVNVNVTPPMVLQYTITGSTSWVAPLTGNVKALIVGGGGGSGGALAGGGGGGGVTYIASASITKGTSYTLAVGAGGTAGGNVSGPAPGNGSNSQFGSNVSLGGGAGGIYGYSGGASGGSGGGGAGNATSSSVTLGGSGTSNQGFAGGNGFVFGTGSLSVAGGGGGAGGSGSNATSSGGQGGVGGIGIANSITGSAVYYGGGGGGASRYSSGGVGGLGGGGSGATGSSGTTTLVAVAGSNGLGGGAGGGGNETNGQIGGSGVVILAIP